MMSMLERSRAAHQEHLELIEKRAALVQAEIAKKKVESVLSLMPAAVYTCDLDGHITYCNQHAVELWGRAPKLDNDEDKYCGSFRLILPDGSSLARDQCRMAVAVKTGETFRNEEITVERPNGSRILVRMNISPFYDEHGQLAGAINTFQDVSHLKKAEQASLHLAALVESSDDAIVAKDLDGIVKSWNPAAERLFGYTAAEIVGKPITTIIPPDRSDEESRILEQIRRGERIEHYDTVRQRKDGSPVEISLTISPIKDAHGKIIGASKIAREITKRKQAETALREARDELARANQELEKRVKERTAELERANTALLKDLEEQRRLEAQLRQAQKMESIGTLAGGIAHDFNNVLNIIKGYASSVASLASGNEEMTEQLEVIDDAIERGTGVVRQLLTLARKTESRLISSSANELISGLTNLLKQTLPKTIDLSLELRVKLPPVMADPNQITQALLNLCVNARDAMPQGGRLTLRTSVVDGATINDAGAQAREYVCI
ncbi:MAG TPA: PAS domain S-box protein, partial [Candidatus Binatia bacterium]|nr:PAS domain S-box protein [Candidatus Binatia bacterium]